MRTARLTIVLQSARGSLEKLSPTTATRPLRFNGHQAFLLEQTRPPPMLFTNHESRNTNHGFWVLKPFSLFFRPGRHSMSTGGRESWRSTCRRYGTVRAGHESGISRLSLTTIHKSLATDLRVFTNHETRDTVFGVPLGTEALQSCFFRPGLLGKRTGRRQGTVRAGRESGLHQPQATDFKVFTRHETRLYSRITRYETRITAFVFFTNHETRNTVFLVPLGTEGLQSFFSVPACLA